MNYKDTCKIVGINTKEVTVDVTEDTYERLKNIADENNMTINEVIRNIIDDYSLNNEDVKE